MRITDDFWSETMQAKIQLSDIFNVKKERHIYNLELYIL